MNLIDVAELLLFSNSFYLIIFRVDFDRFIPKIDVYSCAGESLRRKSLDNSISRVPDLAKPPISLEDLKQLEEDVHEKITNNASLKELDTLRNKIAHQLIIEDIKSLSSKERKNKTVNPTTQNNLSFTKINIQSSDHVNNPGEDSKIPVGSVKEINPPAEGSNKSSHSQIESSLKNKPTKSPTKFSHMLPNLESQLLERSKKEKRRDSLTGKSEKVSKSPEKKKGAKNF